MNKHKKNNMKKRHDKKKGLRKKHHKNKAPKPNGLGGSLGSNMADWEEWDEENLSIRNES